MIEISVVIPVYGCRACLEELHRRLVSALAAITQSYEIILVNDACPQNSWEVIKQIALKDPRVKGLDLSRNFGQIRAITAGLHYAEGDWVVVMDCDLQDQPEEIIRLYNKAQEGYDVVFARRAVRKDTVLKKLSSHVFYAIYSYFTAGAFDSTICNFSISRRCVTDGHKRMGYRQALQLDGGNPFAAGLDHIFGAVGDLHVAVAIHGGDVAGIEPAVRLEHFGAFALVIALGHRRPAHFQAAEGLAVPGDLLAGVVGDLHLDAERRL